MTDPQKNLQAILSSPEGKKLMALLTADGGKTLKDAGSALQSGDEAGAKARMAPLLQNSEIQSLLKSLDQSLEHG